MVVCVKKIPLTSDVYACVLSDGDIYIGKLSKNDKPYGKSFVMSPDLERFTFGMRSKLFHKMNMGHQVLDYHTGSVSVVYNEKATVVTETGDICVLDDHLCGNAKQGMMFSRNTQSKSCNTEVKVGQFTKFNLVKGTTVCSCGSVVCGEMAKESGNLKGVKVMTNLLDNPDACDTLVAIGEFEPGTTKTQRGIKINACGTIRMGSFNKEKDELVVGTRLEACGFWTNPKFTFPHISSGVYDPEHTSIRVGVRITSDFIQNAGIFSKTGIWTDCKGDKEAHNGVLAAGSFANQFMDEELNGLLVHSDGYVSLGKISSKTTINKGIQITPNDVHTFGLPNQNPTRMQTWKSNLYDCEFVNKKPNGFGKIAFKNGNMFYGYIKDGMIYYIGIMSFANGHAYLGQIKDKKRNGYGINITKAGKVKPGFFVDDKLVKLIT